MFQWSTRISERSSVSGACSRSPAPTARMTAQSTCCLEQLSRPADSLTCHDWRGKQWRVGESLASGIIHPSSSFVGTGFCFVKKKDSLLRPCIDYWAPNDITVRNIHFPSWMRILSRFTRRGSSPSWICETCIAVATSGRPHLTLPWDILNI